MKDKLKKFEKIKSIYLNGFKVVEYTLFDDSVSFTYDLGRDDTARIKIKFNSVKATENDNVFLSVPHFEKEGKSSFKLVEQIKIEIKPI